MKYPFLPSPQGLYHPKNERDGCGIGFVAHIKGAASHGIVEQALAVLCNLDHRGARGCEVNTGDGAGILTQIPDRFFRNELSRQGVDLPERGRYGVAMLFLPPDEAQRRACEQRLEEIAAGRGTDGPGLARRAHRRGRSRRHGALLRALHPAAVHRRRRRTGRGARLRAQALPDRQAGKSRDPPRRPLARQRVTSTSRAFPAAPSSTRGC